MTELSRTRAAERGTELGDTRTQHPKMKSNEQMQLFRVVAERAYQQKLTSEQRTELIDTLDASPHLAQEVFDMAHVLRDSIIRQLAAQEGLRVVLHQQANELASGLGYQESSTLERMLIEVVVLCWLRWIVIERRYQVAQQEPGMILRSGDALAASPRMGNFISMAPTSSDA